MDKDLISRSKTLEWINENWEMERTAGTKESSVRAELWRDFYLKVSSDHLSPDPIPLPTIKPGDKVVITDAMNEYFIGTKAIVEKISKSAPFSAKLKGIHGDWPLSSLEVSHD